MSRTKDWLGRPIHPELQTYYAKLDALYEKRARRAAKKKRIKDESINNNEGGE